jgi:DNA repair exonuclease SbcCD ATPase subunit
MFFLSFNLTIIEVIVLLAGAVILGITVHFVIVSRRSLKKYIQPEVKPRKEKKPLIEEKQRDLCYVEERLPQIKQRQQQFAPEIVQAAEPSKDHLIHSLRQTVAQQQKLLNGFLKQIDELDDNGKEELKLENEDLRREIRSLESLVDKKQAENQRLEQQVSTAQSMVARIDEVVLEFEQLQSRMKELEVQAGRANSLEIELEEARETYESVHKDLYKKQEKLEQVISENQDLKNQVHETEDKLSEANRQRQQLFKKVQFLQDLNEDLHNMSDANKKLQNELRRIGELESMLNMIAEERDQLLRKQNGK